MGVGDDEDAEVGTDVRTVPESVDQAFARTAASAAR
jgi:hypothetical protein